jgi:protoporphyrinogen oxidase
MATLRELLGDDLQRRPRHGRISMSRRFVAFPPRPFDLVRHLPPSVSARLAYDMATARGRRRDDANFASVIETSLGPTMLSQFYAPYVEKLFGVPAAHLDAELARRRVGARGTGGLVKRVLRPAPERAVFYYPRRGYGQICDVLADAAVGAGAQIETGAEVIALDGARVTTRSATYDASVVCSTLPLPVVARVANAPVEVADAAARMTTRAMTFVYLALPAAQWTPFDAHYFPELDVPMSRVSEPKNYRSSSTDPRDVTVLCAEVPCAVGDDWWSLGADDAGAQVRDALMRTGLAVPEPVAVEVRRAPNVYPVYRTGYRDAFDVVDAWANTLPDFVHYGRQGLFAHDNTHHALAMAWAVADALDDDDRVVPERWRRARAAFASHVVED